MTSFNPPSALIVYSFLALVAAVFVAVIVWFVRFGGRRGTMLVSSWIVWLIFTAVLAALGVAARFSLPPPIMLLIVLMLVSCVVLYRSDVVKRLADAPFVFLAGMHAFRLPLEFLLDALAREGAMPDVLTFRGANFDVVTGVLGVLVLVTKGKNMLLVRATQWAGALLLFVIVVTAVSSMPTPLQWIKPEPPLLLPTTFPFIWLPTILVYAAMLLHVVTAKALQRSR